MASRRGATGLCGIVAVDKPAGMTSHDVVASVRRATGEGRVGHAGTLDPAATGLLVVLVGPYTRLEPYISGASKEYVARIAFGTETDTDDAEGEVRRTAEVPPGLFDASCARDILAGFLGESMQKPPAYSAIKVDGRVSHRVARSGGGIELAPRRVVVERADLLDTDSGSRTWDVGFRVSKGTYVRALARDVGRAAGSAAHLASLRRTASGELRVDDAHELERVVEAARSDALGELFVDPLTATGLPQVAASAEEIANGRPLERTTDAGEGQPVAVVGEGRRLLAVYRRIDGTLRAEAVFPESCR